MPIDLVCGMSVDEVTPYKVENQEQTYYFCSQSCAEEFEENIEEYVETQGMGFGE